MALSCITAVLCVVVIVAPAAAFMSSSNSVLLRADIPGKRLACISHTRLHIPWVKSAPKLAALQMKGADEDRPNSAAEVFFSLKQRLQKANVWLIGMDGSDKEVIGKELAKKLGYKFMDTNEIITSLLKTPIETAITKLGEEEFNKIETAVLDQVQAYYGTVVSTGSIAPVFPENWSKFRTGLVAYCKVPPHGLKGLGLQDALASEAPLISGMPDESRLELLLAQREIKYSQADVTIVLSGTEDLEAKLVAVADGIRKFIVENPAADKPTLGEAHARAISRVMGLGSVDDATAKRLKEEEEEAKKKADVLNAAYYGSPNSRPKEQVEKLNALIQDEETPNSDNKENKGFGGKAPKDKEV